MSTLHARIIFIKILLYVAYKLPQISKRKSRSQTSLGKNHEEFREIMGLLVYILTGQG